MRPASAEKQPGRPTLAEAVHRAVEVTDPSGRSDALGDLERRFEDRDEPLTAVQPVLAETLGEQRGAIDPQSEEPAVELALAVVTYLAHRRDEFDEDREQLLRLTVDSEFAGSPPPRVEEWLAEEHVELRL